MTDVSGDPVEAVFTDEPLPEGTVAVRREDVELQNATFDSILESILRLEDVHSNLVKHAERELRLAGFYNHDPRTGPVPDYGPGAIAEQVLGLLRLLARQRHSGGSIGITLQLFEALANFGTLSPNDHSLFRDVSEYSGKSPGTVLQDSRDFRWFSEDGGATWYNVEDK